MYVQEFHSLEDNLRMQIDMTKVEAVLEKSKGTIIVTGTDSYLVADPFSKVVESWQNAAVFERQEYSEAGLPK